MTSELVRRAAPDDSWIDMIGPVGKLSTIIAKTAFVPSQFAGKPEAVAACILTGRELGLGPMTSLRGINVIDGSPSLTTELLGARMLAAGHSVEWLDVSDKQVSVRVTRGDGLSSAEVTWTLKDAERAGLLRKRNWQQYPRAMLRSRALSECAQLVCPDVSLGLNTEQVSPAPDQVSHASLATVELVSSPPSGTRESVAESVETEEAEEVPPSSVEDDYTQLLSDSIDQLEEHQADETIEEAEIVDLPVVKVSGEQIRALNSILRDIERLTGERLSREQRRAHILMAAGLEPDARASATELTGSEASQAISVMHDELADLRGAMSFDESGE